jgi:hypothetical protein
MRRAALVVRFVLLVATAATVSSALTRRAAADLPSDVAADFNHDGVADLAVGVLGENDVAGAVNVLYGAGGGLSGTGAQAFPGWGHAGVRRPVRVGAGSRGLQRRRLR